MKNTLNSILPSLSELASEEQLIKQFVSDNPFSDIDNQKIMSNCVDLVNQLRIEDEFPFVEKLMNLYSLSSSEGRVLMELSEALLRTPDDVSKEALLTDKLPNQHWISAESYLHLLSGSALSIAGQISDKRNLSTFNNLISRLGLPIVRKCMQSFMKLIASQFIYAKTIEDGLSKAEKKSQLMSFDMLGEAARNEKTALNYFIKYQQAIEIVGKNSNNTSSPSLYRKHGVSVKLSALYGRYETRRHQDVLNILYPRIAQLCELAKSYNIHLTIDAEEDARLDVSVQIICKIIESAICQDWNGFGFALQAYQRRAQSILQIIQQRIKKFARNIHIRLVKGAYWDYEIKIAQQKGLDYFPVFTTKVNTDASYLYLSKLLLQNSNRIYPMFATHNVQTFCAVQQLAKQLGKTNYEFQRLHGLGESMANISNKKDSQTYRIYAPVGGHVDLLAYLIRRLLENGANSSFISQIHQSSISPEQLCENPFNTLKNIHHKTSTIRTGTRLFSNRKNSKGYDLDDPKTINNIAEQFEPFRQKKWDFSTNNATTVINPANNTNIVGYYTKSTATVIQQNIKSASTPQNWENAKIRVNIIHKVADLFEQNDIELIALLCREAGKTLLDATAEIREAVDFCRYYANEYSTLSQQANPPQPRGKVLCIAPWNFPMAIFSGQIIASLVSANITIAKPAEQTPLIAHRLIQLMHEAGIPKQMLHLLACDGSSTSDSLIKTSLVDMIVFTGSEKTAQLIHQNIAQSARPDIPLIAETGGINAMVVDSTILIERTIDDIIISAFQSAGQRCSALRLLFVQDVIADKLINELIGASELLAIGNPEHFNIDVGPIISAQAKQDITDYLKLNQQKIKWQAPLPKETDAGYFIAPTIIELNSIVEINKEVFAPVLHIIRYSSNTPEKLIESINAMGYGLTFALQGRLYNQQNNLAKLSNAGNIYINRDQIGAIVESQPFGGTGFSGTGPKAGGPLYLKVFSRKCSTLQPIKSKIMPSIDGEHNQYSTSARGQILCLNFSMNQQHTWLEYAQNAGNNLVFIDIHNPPVWLIQDDYPQQERLKKIQHFDAFLFIPESEQSLSSHEYEIMKIIRKTISGHLPILPLIHDSGSLSMLLHEKHICINTTASGGNVDLLSIN